jgi:dCTP deaminase
MILTGPQIEAEVARRTITIDPFHPAQINPNSYNFRLGELLLVYEEEVLDPAVENKHRTCRIPDEGISLEPDRIYLGSTAEVIGSTEFVPIIRARSSTARLGLFVHVTADLIDLGAFGRLTLQLHAVQPVRIYAGMEIGQVTFWRTRGERVLYDGKYQGSTGPVASRSHQDWETRVLGGRSSVDSLGCGDQGGPSRRGDRGGATGVRPRHP